MQRKLDSFDLRKVTEKQEFVAQLQSASIVHREHLYGRGSDGRQTFDSDLTNLEVFVPTVAARVK